MRRRATTSSIRSWMGAKRSCLVRSGEWGVGSGGGEWGVGCGSGRVDERATIKVTAPFCSLLLPLRLPLFPVALLGTVSHIRAPPPPEAYPRVRARDRSGSCTAENHYGEALLPWHWR